MMQRTVAPAEMTTRRIYRQLHFVIVVFVLLTCLCPANAGLGPTPPSVFKKTLRVMT
jgi:hypothetical protein